MRRKMEPSGPLGVALHELMTEARWLEIKALADAAGVTRQTVYTILKGGTTSVDTLQAIADALATHPLTGERDPVFRTRAWDRLLTAAGQPNRPAVQSQPRPDPEPSLSDEEQHLLRAFRGRLRPMKDFLIQADGLEEIDRRQVIAAVEWAMAHIEAMQQWEAGRKAAVHADLIARHERAGL